ncbi:polysaccharide biosynthesis protein [Paenibacillus sp. LPE1-1-1.1]|uniref:polysaccharide biosynthesis protein n=1 Tax=Paenibacillus sp. LPE1-1-1.1 TaxID=3135230 RepID=UPI003447376B
MNYKIKLMFLAIADSVILALSLIFSVYLTDEKILQMDWSSINLLSGIIFIASSNVILAVNKSYKALRQYTGIREIVKVFQSILMSTILYAVTDQLFMINPRPIPEYLILGAMAILMLCLFRVEAIVWKYKFKTQPKMNRKALIIGAGDAGTIVSKQLILTDREELYPFGFIDDDPRKLYFEINGLPVLGDRTAITRIVAEYGITDIIVAIPSATKKTIKEIVEICKATTANIRILPRMYDVILGQISADEIRDIDVKDLLGRDLVISSMANMEHFLKDKIILITGAGGSIGGELVYQTAQFNPSRLIMFGHGENSIHQIEMNVRERFPHVAVESVIGDIQNLDDVELAFQQYQPHVVFHAAAHKHVPLMEHNPGSAVKNNVFGTINMAESAIKFGVDRFVYISTDKAVNPINIMGLTKRVSEMMIQYFSLKGTTKFSIVRFGNVLESRGSVIPIFKKQIAKGGPVTVTHPDMIRYFMTIPEAVHLVMQAGALSKGGEVFVLDMGEPVKISDLAKSLILLAGYVPERDIKIEYTGVRPGEKLAEALFYNEERSMPSSHPHIFIATPQPIQWELLLLDMKRLELAISQQDQSQLKRCLDIIIRNEATHLPERDAGN